MMMYRRLLFTTFDPEVAPFFGVSTDWVDTIFSLVLAGTIVVSIQVLGVTLIAAALVIPPITARLLTDNFNRLMALSIAIGALCGLAGIYMSYFVDVSSGANIVLVAAAVFLAALAYSSVSSRITAARGMAARRAEALRGLTVD